MFEIGEYIVHSNKGVCVVEDVGKLKMQGMPADKMYYTLRQCYTNSSRVFTPVDSTKVYMRPVMSCDEAKKLVDNIGNIECLWIKDEKCRENDYKEAFSKCDCTELVRIIKTIYFHRLERIENGKKTTAIDDRYFKLAEERLYGELACSLNMDKDKVRDYIIDIMENKS